MKVRSATILLGFVAAIFPVFAGDANLTRPKAGKVDILPLSEVKPGMKGVAWTVIQGTVPEPIPVEITEIGAHSRNLASVAVVSNARLHANLF